jgi:hypothetical protein
MIKKLMFCVLAIVVINTKAQVLPSVGFINYFGDDPAISSVSSGIDGGSKVYTAGRGFFANQDIVVQCTDSTGLILWTYTYDNGGYDSPNKICTDAIGNSYITGVSAGGSTGLDMILIVLNPTGAVIFTKRFDNGFNDADHGMDVISDANGDVYVTCKAKNGSGYWNAITLKYQVGTGALLWQNTYTGSGFDDIGVCLTVANNQNDVIVAGTSNNGSDADIVVYQLDASTGSQGWVNMIAGTNGQNDNVNAIILAGANVVIAGMTDNTSTDKDYTTAKIDASSGSLIFQSDYDFSATDEATSLVSDSTGNIGVTGIVYNSGTSLYEYHTLLYDSLGTPYWTHKEVTNCNAVNVDPVIVCDTIAHHFYIVGEKENATRDILVYQLTPGGNLGWEKSIDRPLNNSTDVGTSIVVNGLGVLFISGSTTDILTGDFDMTTIKVAQTPVYFPLDLGSNEPNDPNFVFQKNQGQLLRPNGSQVAESEINYYYQGSSPSYYFNNSMISHILTDRDTIQDSLVRVDINFLGANQLADIYHYEPIDARKHYYGTTLNGITDVRSYSRLFVPEVYPNVDLHHYSNLSGLKSYFVFKVPDESIAALRFQIEGANNTSIDATGNLIASTDLGDINMGALTAYQAVYNPSNPTVPTLNPLTVSWNSIGGNMYNFSISGYAPFWPIVVYMSKQATSSSAVSSIDNLHWATFKGGQGYEETFRNRVDAKNNLYTTGRTAAATYPTSAGAFLQSIPTNALAGTHYGFVDKYRGDGKLLWSSVFGGLGNSCGDPPMTGIYDVTADSLYNVYIVGFTTANQLSTKTISTPGALNYTSNSFSSGGLCQDAFIAKMNPTGSALHYSSYWGGSSDDSFRTVDYVNGKILVGGGAASSNAPFNSPQAGAHWQTNGTGVFLQLDTAGALVHNTRVSQLVVDADVDKNGNYYQVATTWGIYGLTSVFGPTGSYLQAIGSSVNWTLQRFNSSNALNWSTYIGGNSADNVSAMTIRDTILAITGQVASTNFPTVKSPSDSGEVVRNNDYDIATIKFDLTSGQMVWSAFHATFHSEISTGIALDKDFNLYVSGNVKCGTNTGTNTSCAPALFKLFAYPGSYYQAPVGNAFIGNETFLIGYNSNNQRKWTTLYSSASNQNTTGHDDRSSGLAISPAGRLFMSGYTNVRNNSLPMVQWNSSCYYDNTTAETSGSANDPFIAMWEVSEFLIVGIEKNDEKAVFKDNVILFPNPNNGIFTIGFKEPITGRTKINVMNLLGQTVYSDVEELSGNREVSLNLKYLTTGVYFVNVSEGSNSTILKFVVN